MAGEKIGPAGPVIDYLSWTALPADEQMLWNALCDKIYNKFIGIPHLTSYVKVEKRERFPETEQEDIDVSTVPDQIILNKKRTGLIQIGIPTVEEFENTSDVDTQLNFTVPMTLDLEVVDSWDDKNNILWYKNSADIVMALYMTSRRAFKNDRTFGYNNCEAEYLQQVNTGTLVYDEETGGRLHTIDWSLTIKCRGIAV